jgi:hypothetical protein
MFYLSQFDDVPAAADDAVDEGAQRVVNLRQVSGKEPERRCII